MHLLREIELYIRRLDMPVTRFGREAANDPRFVLDLRRGREPRPETAERIRRYMAARDRLGGTAR